MFMFDEETRVFTMKAFLNVGDAAGKSATGMTMNDLQVEM